MQCGHSVKTLLIISFVFFIALELVCMHDNNTFDSFPFLPNIILLKQTEISRKLFKGWLVLD